MAINARPEIETADVPHADHNVEIIKADWNDKDQTVPHSARSVGKE